VTDPAFQADALGPFADNVPTSYMWNPGSYVQWTMPWTCYLKSDVGFRYDFVQTNARLGELGPEFVTNSNLTPPFNEGDSLYAAYITNELKLDKGLTVRLGLGHSEAPPTLLERYSNGVFVGIGQDGFTKLIGDPTLKPALDTQVDAALVADYDCWRGKAGAYYAWINDYITYTDDLVFGPTFPSARTFRFANTRLATLTGFELAGEYDLNCCLSPFGRMAYVYGVDQELHASLPDIPPLDTVFGIRWHDPCKDRKWQVELFGRADYRQTHVGYIPSSSSPGLIPVGEPTPGFLVWNIHAYYYYNKNLKFIAGIDNIFDRTYIQALDLRLSGPFTAPPSSGGTAIFPTSFVYEPGFSPYLGLEWKY
jgi:iron complex outermembrane receptor protein